MFRTWWKSLTRCPQPYFRPQAESLEERAVPAAIYWARDASGAWEVASNWSPARVPGPGDDVYLDRPSGGYTITHGSGYHYAGTVSAATSTLEISGGTLQIQSSSQLDGPLVIRGGTLFLGGELITTGEVIWSSGQVQSYGGYLHNYGLLYLEGSATKVLDGLFAGYVSLKNAASILHAGTGPLQINTLNSLTNEESGTYDLATDVSILGRGSFLNEGTFRKSFSDGRSLVAPDFTTSGSLEIYSGTLTFGDTLFYRFVQTGGTTYLYGGELAVVSTFDIQGGRLQGYGTITGNVRNAGRIDVGWEGSVGYLHIIGNYTQVLSGSLWVEVADAADYDYLWVSGTATLSGTIHLSFLESYTPAAGDFFYVFFFGTRSGEFTSMTVPPLKDPLLAGVDPWYDENALSFWVVPA